MTLDHAEYGMVVDLLAVPDPPDLVGSFYGNGRGFRVTQPGDPRRRQTVFLPLVTRWAQRRYLDLDRPAYIGPAKRRAS